MSRSRRFQPIAVWLSPLLLMAQAGPARDAPVLKNTGEPIRVPFACAEDELQEAGLLCTEEEPCAVYLELSAIATAGKKLFVAGDLHATAVTLSSVMLSTDDAGATWKEPSARIRAAAVEQLEFYDLDHAWAAGETQYPLPRDPFFLLSTDGGSSWRTRPVTEDGGPGSVQRFWFDSAQHGELIVDAGKTAPSGRFLTYESETGGESWMIRSTGDKMPSLRRAPATLGNSDFRLRANGKSYQIEKRVGEKWEQVASFLTEVASCSVKPLEAKEPPVETQVGTEVEPPKDYVEEIRLGEPAKTPAKPARKKGSKP
jgi:hypothetical protein